MARNTCSNPARPRVRPRSYTAGNSVATRLAKGALAAQRCQQAGDPSPAVTKNRTDDAHEDHWGLHTSPFHISREEVDIKRGEPRSPHARQPRAMSASARGQAITRVVDGCCKNLPATPRFSTGAARFLQQWDKATRTQREELLRVLADRLLLSGRSHGGSSPRLSQNKKRGEPHVDLCREMGSLRIDGGDVARGVPSLEPQGAPRPPRSPLRPDNLCPPGLSGHGGSHLGRVGDSISHSRFPPHACPMGAVALTGSAVDDAKAENSPYRGNHEVTASDSTGTSDVVGFLELLGPHADLLATRVSSLFRTSFAGGHAVGPCLRVCALIVESTAGQGVTAGVDGDGYNVKRASGPSLVGQQLCTPEVLSTALEIAAAPPRARVVAGDSNPDIKRAKKGRRRQKQAKAATVVPTSLSSSKGRDQHAQEDQEEQERGEALRLLLALVRVGGRSVKEYLTCPGRFSPPRTTDATAAPALGSSGDAFDRIVSALRRPTCRPDVRTAGARLLVELGSEEHPDPAGNGCDRVWNAVLCLLGVLGDEDPADGPILGCRIAFDLLAASSKPRGTRGGGRGPGSDDLLGGSISSRRQGRQRPRRPMRPELMLLPSVLSLSLSDRGCVREAAGKLAVLLVTHYPRPCCYLLVACVAGLFGLVSGVDRGAPVAWIERTQPRPRRRELAGTHGSDLQNQAATDGSEMDEPSREHEPEEDGRWTPGAHESHSQALPVENDACRGRVSGTEGTKEGSPFLSAGSKNGASGRLSTGTPPPPPPPPGFDLPARVARRAIPALDLLRRICTQGAAADDKSTRVALAHALAPLAALDLVVGPARPAVASSSGGSGGTGNAEVGMSGTVFVTQTYTTAANGVAARCADGGGNDAGEEDPRVRREKDRPPGGDDPLRGGGTRSVSLQDETPLERPGGERWFAGRRSYACCAQPTGELCLAVAETLLAMYRGARCDGAADGAGQPETLDLNAMIDAALDGCTALSGSLRDGDGEAMARVFSSCCSSSTTTSRGGGGDPRDGTCVELRTLRKNLTKLAARLGRVRPPPPSPLPCTAAAPASRGGAVRDPRGAPRHSSSEDRQGGAGQTEAATFSENEWRASTTETLLPGFSDGGEAGGGGATRRGATLFGEGARDRTEPDAEGIFRAPMMQNISRCPHRRSAKVTTRGALRAGIHSPPRSKHRASELARRQPKHARQHKAVP